MSLYRSGCNSVWVQLPPETFFILRTILLLIKLEVVELFISKKRYELMQEEMKCLKERHQCDRAVIAALKLKLKGEKPTIVGTKEMMDYVNYELQDC